MTKNAISRFILPGAVAGLVVVGMFGGSAIAGTFASSNARTAEVAAPDYPNNKAGLSFGSAALAAAPEDEPDLILVETAEGVSGYVYKSDLDEASGANVSSPREALSWQEAAQDLRKIPVYEVDGITQIGSFVVGGAREATD